MVEAALGGRFASKFVDGREELDGAVAKCFVETPEQLRCRCIAVGSNRQQQLILKVSKFSLQMCSTGTTGPDVINHVDLDARLP